MWNAFYNGTICMFWKEVLKDLSRKHTWTIWLSLKIPVCDFHFASHYHFNPPWCLEPFKHHWSASNFPAANTANLLNQSKFPEPWVLWPVKLVKTAVFRCTIFLEAKPVTWYPQNSNGFIQTFLWNHDSPGRRLKQRWDEGSPMGHFFVLTE